MTDIENLACTFPTAVQFDPAVEDGYMKYYVPIPDAVGRLQSNAVTHVEGQLDGNAFHRVRHLRSDGSRCFKFGLIWLEQAGIEAGRVVAITLAPALDPDRVDLLDELATALRAAPDMEHYWAFLSPSRCKTLVYNVARAKRPETRPRRAEAVLDEVRRAMETGTETSKF